MPALKYSRQRESIMRFLLSRYDHPTADTVYLHVKEEFPNIEKSSSYDLLVDAVIHNYKSKQLQATDGAEIN